MKKSITSPSDRESFAEDLKIQKSQLGTSKLFRKTSKAHVTVDVGEQRVLERVMGEEICTKDHEIKRLKGTLKEKSMSMHSESESYVKDHKFQRKPIRTSKVRERTESVISGLEKAHQMAPTKEEEIDDSSMPFLESQQKRNLTESTKTMNKVSMGRILILLMLGIFATITLASVWKLDMEYVAEKMSDFEEIAQRAVDQYIIGCDGTVQYIAMREQIHEQENQLDEHLALQESERKRLEKVSKQMQNEIIGKDLVIGDLRSQLQERQSKYDAHRQSQCKLKSLHESNINASTAGATWTNIVANISIGFVCAIIAVKVAQRIFEWEPQNGRFTHFAAA